MDINKFDGYVKILRAHLSDYRLFHSLKVAESAEYLSKKYGGDSEKMYLAGLLHDILKEADSDEIFAYTKKYGINLTPIEEKQKKLWHAVVGAEYIRHELSIDDEEILTAVRYHTTGRAGMSVNEKILFIADFISADRNYDGVDIMREKAEISLESAMLTGLGFTITELIEKENPVHPDSMDAYNDIILNYKNKGLI